MTETPQDTEFPKCPYGFNCEIMNETDSKNYSKKNCSRLQNCRKLVEILSSSSDIIEKFYINLDARFKQDIESWRYYHDRIFPPSGSIGILNTIKSNKKKRKILLKNVFLQMTEHPFFMKQVWEHETAVSFLKKYGNHQSFDSFGIDEQISEIEASLKKLKRNLKNLKWGYIAPKGAYVNCKNPKGGDVNNNSESPRFYVLKSSKAQFKSKKDPSKKISNLYLCNDIFLANYEVIQARVGIKRRDHLQKISKKLMKAVSELQKAIDEADVNFNFDDHDNNWDFEERDFDGMDIYRLVRKDRQKSLLE